MTCILYEQFILLDLIRSEISNSNQASPFRLIKQLTSIIYVLFYVCVKKVTHNWIIFIIVKLLLTLPIKAFMIWFLYDGYRKTVDQVPNNNQYIDSFSTQ